MSTLDSYWTYAQFLATRYNKNIELIENNRKVPAASTTAMYASARSIAIYMDNGYCEYKSVGHVWVRALGWHHNARYKPWYFDSITGAKAMWAICLHEFAHVMSPLYSHHNSDYQSVLYRLIMQNDYGEFLHIVSDKPVNQPAPIESELDKILLKYK